MKHYTITCFQYINITIVIHEIVEETLVSI